MEHVIQEEKTEYICDATGKKILNENGDYYSPSCYISFDFGYGSNLDGFRLKLDFNEESSKKLIKVLSDNFPRIKKIIDNKMKKLQ